MKGTVRILLAVFGAAAASTLVAFLVVAPLQARITHDHEVIRSRRAQLAKLGRVSQRIEDLEDEIAQLEGALAYFDDRLPEEREIDVILREVWLIAKAKSLAQRVMRTQTSTETPRCNAQPISMTLEGPFEGFYEFLLGLEQLPRITKIRRFEVAKSPEADGAIQAELLVDIFFEK
jgi:Tfp pilus assembly protein PilO